MISDFRTAFRSLIKSPGYTLVVVLTLAIGIGTSINIFGICGAFFLSPLAIKDSSRAVLLLEKNAAVSMPHGISLPDFEDFRDQTKSLESMVAYYQQASHLSVEGQAPERVWFEAVTPDAFSLHGVKAALGRTLLASDAKGREGDAVVMLSYRMWQTRFGSDPSIVGRPVRINGQSFMVVGVLPERFKSFSYAGAPSLFIPSGSIRRLTEGGPMMLDARYTGAWRVLGLLKNGVSIEKARAEIEVIGAQIAQRFPEEHKDTHTMLKLESRCRPDASVADLLPVFLVLFMGMVSLVLFIACANVANLMLARALTREREFAIRSAIGASRWRIMRQMLVESLLLSLLAGVVGLFIASWAGVVIQMIMPQQDMPTNSDQGSVGWTLVFTVSAALIAGIASGLIPAMRASKADINSTLGNAAGARAGSGRHRFRNILVTGQVTVSLVVLVFAGLFVQSLRRVNQLDLGFRPERMLTLSFDLANQGYNEERGSLFFRQMLERVRAVPAVENAAITQHLPFAYNIRIHGVVPEIPNTAFKDGNAPAAGASIDPAYFATAGVRLERGRIINEHDTKTTPRVAVINEAMAKLFWPGQDAMGKRFSLWKGGPLIEVVGITRTGKYWMLLETPRPYFYLPITQDYAAAVTLVVRTKMDSEKVATDIIAAVHSVDSQLPLFNVKTMEEHMGASVFALLPMRFGAGLASVQGVIGLLLAILGLYSVVAYNVTSRTREIGIRMALGAQPRMLLLSVLKEGMRLTATGLIAGLVVSAVIGFGLSFVLFGLSPFDPLVLGGVALLVSGIAILACFLPARRAMRVNPVEALRAE